MRKRNKTEKRKHVCEYQYADSHKRCNNEAIWEVAGSLNLLCREHAKIFRRHGFRLQHITILSMLAMLLFSGCAITDWIDKPLPYIDFGGTNTVAEVTNEPAVVAAPVEGEEQVSAISGDRASIALDSKGVPYVVFDKGIGNTLWMAERQANGAWASKVFAQGSKGGEYDAGRIFLPHIEIDGLDRVWVSAKFGVKEWGSMGGEGLWCPGKFVLTHTKGTGAASVRGNGKILLMSENFGVLVCADGKWECYDCYGNKMVAGQYKVGSSGEKIASYIEGNVFHLAENGCSTVEAQYINSTMKKPVVWASYKAYPEMGVDTCHPTICANGQAVYIATQYAKGIFMNVWDGTKMLYSPTNLLMVAQGGYTGVERFGPQMCKAPDGGVWVAYCKAKRIKLRRVWIGTVEVVCDDLQTGWVDAVRMSAPRDICSGRCPTIAERDGVIHLVYSNGGMRYRRIAE